MPHGSLRDRNGAFSNNSPPRRCEGQQTPGRDARCHGVMSNPGAISHSGQGRHPERRCRAVLRGTGDGVIDEARKGFVHRGLLSHDVTRPPTHNHRESLGRRGAGRRSGKRQEGPG
ncbi:MAG: hypothetical protein MZV64_71245 [Ignavibacteriales bacterium]|nr:hypothetical protein [Ignavibacteriales bacterium]